MPVESITTANVSQTVPFFGGDGVAGQTKLPLRGF